MGIFEQVKHIDPRYNFLEKYIRVMYRGFWTPARYEKNIKEKDAPHYFNVMDEVDQEAIKRCILLVSMVEDKVKTYWSGLNRSIPQTVVGEVGGLFGQSEVTHARSYRALADALGLTGMLDDILDLPVVGDRIKYLTKYLENDPKVIGKKRILKTLVLFTALVEKGSLFTQFYILMSYSQRNRGLKSISKLQRTTATEENVHYLFGIDLVNIIKKEYPQLWDEYLVELINKNIMAAYEAELKLIDWIFEAGVPEHLTKEEVINFLNYNFNIISKDLKLDIYFDYDQELYEERNEWFTVKTVAPVEGDFFDDNLGGYASEDVEIEEVDYEDIFGDK